MSTTMRDAEHREWAEGVERVWKEATDCIMEHVDAGGSLNNAIKHAADLYSVNAEALRHEVSLRHGI